MLCALPRRVVGFLQSRRDPEYSEKGNVTDGFAVSEEWVRDMTEERGKHAAKISSEGDWLESLMKRV